ncbi:MAG: hypothetical protein AB1458_10810 [Bacteroidota bacterium]
MRKLIIMAWLAAALALSFTGCQKEDALTPGKGHVSGQYASMQDFYDQNRPAIWSYAVNATTGGTFSTPQGTTVTVPANAFTDPSGNPVSGSVTVRFQDIYKKSDMLFSQMPTSTASGPLNSGGQFFIKAEQNNAGLVLAPGKKIVIGQPASLTGGVDSGMTAFVAVPDSMEAGYEWVPAPYDTLYPSMNSYVYNLYGLNSNGTWSNCDNPYPFASFPQTTLTLSSSSNLSAFNYQIDAWLIFTNQNAGIHLYLDNNSFQYIYAPLGFQCTAVIMGVRDGKLFACFQPVTITSNTNVNFTLTEMSTADFKTRLDALN